MIYLTLKRNVNKSLFGVFLVVVGTMNAGCIWPYVKNEKNWSGSRISSNSVEFVEKGTTTKSMVVANLGAPSFENGSQCLAAYYWIEKRPGAELRMAFAINITAPIELLTICMDDGRAFVDSLVERENYLAGSGALLRLSKRKAIHYLYLVQFDHEDRVLRSGFERLVLRDKSLEKLESFVHEWGLSMQGCSTRALPIDD